MLEGKHDHGGASENHDNRIEGEILGALSALKFEYETEQLELAWHALKALLRHVERTEGLAALVEFSEKAGKMLSKDAAAIRDILDEDFRKRLN